MRALFRAHQVGPSLTPRTRVHFPGAVYLRPSIGLKEAMVQQSSVCKIDFLNIDLVSEVNKRRTAMATRYLKVL